MVVTFRTLNPDTEEQLSGRFSGILRVTAGSPVVGGRVLVSTSLGRQQFTSKLIERLVVADAFVNPQAEFMHAGGIQLLRIRSEHIGPLQRPERREVITVDQLIDQQITLVGGRVRQICLSFGDSRQPASRVEVSTAQEFFVRANIRRQNLQLLQLGKNQIVHKSCFGRIVPDEARNLLEERDVAGCHLVEVTGKDGRFTTRILVNQARFVDLSHRLI